MDLGPALKAHTVTCLEASPKGAFGDFQSESLFHLEPSWSLRFLKTIAQGDDSVVDGEGVNLILWRDNDRPGLDLSDTEIKRGMEGEVLAHVTNPFYNAHRPSDDEGLGPITLGHGHEKTRNTQDMVSMKVRYQDGPDGCNAESSLENLSLGTLSTIEQEGISFPPDGQGRMFSPFRRNRTACAQKDHFHAECIAVFWGF